MSSNGSSLTHKLSGRHHDAGPHLEQIRDSAGRIWDLADPGSRTLMQTWGHGIRFCSVCGQRWSGEVQHALKFKRAISYCQISDTDTKPCRFPSLLQVREPMTSGQIGFCVTDPAIGPHRKRSGRVANLRGVCSRCSLSPGASHSLFITKTLTDTTHTRPHEALPSPPGITTQKAQWGLACGQELYLTNPRKL